MVIERNFSDIFTLSSKTENLTLPHIKYHKLCLQFNKDNITETKYHGNKPILPFAETDVFHANIENSRCLVEKCQDYKAVYEVTFNIDTSQFKFKPGDTIGIIPQNSKEEVEEFLGLLNSGFNADFTYTITLDKAAKTKVPPHVPIQSTLRHVFTNCIDFRSIVKKLFLLEISQYTEDTNEKKALEYLCSKEGASMYTQHILNKNISIVDILQTFKTCKPPVGVILAHLPRLLPRPYSIVNSQKKNDKDLKICFSVMSLDNKRKGLATGWLERTIVNDDNIDVALKKLSLDNLKSCKERIPMYIRKNQGFCLPQNIETPLLLIAAGTGVAPFIGFLEEILYRKEANPEVNYGDVWLFYGCRNSDVDFLYEKELNFFKEKQVLTKMTTTFSRMENGGIKYVQDALRQDIENVVKFIKDGASLFICGDLTTMAVQVRETILNGFIHYFHFSNEESNEYINELEKDKRYSVDIWS